MKIKILKKIYRATKFFQEEILYKSLYRICYRLNKPTLAGYALALIAKPLNGKRKYRVLCLGRSIFYSDLQALTKFGDNIQYLYFHKMLLGEVVRSFIPELNPKHPNFKNMDTQFIPGYDSAKTRLDTGTEYGLIYHSNPNYKDGKKKINDFMGKMIDVLIKKLNFHAVLSGHYVYVDQQEFIKNCEERNIPGIILYKEGLPQYWTNKYLDKGTHPANTGCRFIGSKMLFANEYSKNFELKNLKGLEEENAVVVGVPRYDYYRFNDKKSTKKQITFFVFELYENVRFYRKFDKKIANKIKLISEMFIKNIFCFAMENEDYTVYFKLKGSADRYTTMINEVREKYFFDTNLKNIIITPSEPVDQLILDSEAILGYNSTVLLESVLCDKKVICPDFGGLDYGDYFIDHEGLALFTNNYQEMSKAILENKNSSYQINDLKQDFIDKATILSDNSFSYHAEKEIIKVINEKKDNIILSN